MIANKVDDASHEAAIWEFMGLGLGEPFPVSALHGKGTGDLLGALITHLPEGSDRGPRNPSAMIRSCSPSRSSGDQMSASPRCSTD